jgi:16S rRNA (uracil1498-N3)-methyltransferase
VGAPVFFARRALLLGGSPVWLDGSEGRHAALVRRLGAGERALLTDGAGAMADCVVQRAERERLLLDVVDVRIDPPPTPRVLVVQALVKGERGEQAVETLTEVGVDVVVPWSAQRSVARWREARGERALQRWRTTAAEAAKQARRTWWPEVTPVASTADVAALMGRCALAVVLHEEALLPLADVAPPDAGDVVLVVGPEGGVAPDELATLEAAGALTRRMGPTVLRTSTAGTVAAAVLLSRSRRWA